MIRDSSNDVFTLKAKEDIVISYTVPPNNNFSKTFSKGTVFYGKKYRGSSPLDSVMKTTPDGTAPDWDKMGQVWIDVPMNKVEVITVKTSVQNVNAELLINQRFPQNARDLFAVITEEDKKRHRQLQQERERYANMPKADMPIMNIVSPDDPRFNSQKQGTPVTDKKPVGLIVGLVLILGLLYHMAENKPA